MDIDIVSVCETDMISRKAGELIREKLLANWAEPELRLFLHGRKIASVSFFDEAIGLLMKKGGKTIDEMRIKLKFPELSPSDINLLNKVINPRLEELDGQSPTPRQK